MTSNRADRPRLGIVVLNYEYWVETLDLPDQFDSSAYRCVPACWPWNPDFWSVQMAAAVAEGVRVPEILEGSPEALASVAAAVDRLAPHCDLILGNCGYFYAARPLVNSDTPTLLSGLEQLPNALQSTRRPVGVITYDESSTDRMLASHPEKSRLRIVGVNDLPAWDALVSA